MCWCKAGYQTQEECKSPSLLFKDSPSAGGHAQLSRPEGCAPPCDLHVPLKSIKWSQVACSGLTGPPSPKMRVGAPVTFRVITRCGRQRSLCRRRDQMEGSGGLCQPCPEKLSTHSRNSLVSVGFRWGSLMPFMGLEGAICPPTGT